MKINEMNIINDLDKENDDLMRHLGILQQFSLEQETNILKDINKYNDNNNEIYNNNNEYENNYEYSYNNKILPKKKNKKIMDMINKNKEKRKENIINNKINERNNKKFTKNFEILEDDEKCIININNHYKNQNEIINNNISKKERNNTSSSDENISELNLNNKLIEDALNVEKQLNNNINNFNQLKNQKNQKEFDIKNNSNNNSDYKDLNKYNYINENKGIAEEKNKLNLEKDVIDKYSLDEEELDSPKNNEKIDKDKDINNIKNEEIINKDFDNINYDNIINNHKNEKDIFINNIIVNNEELEEEINMIKNKNNNINNIEYKYNNRNKNINKENDNDDKENNENFICDLDIFKKLQKQINKKSEVLQKTIDKYNHKPTKIEIINEAKPTIQNKMNIYQNEIDINNNILNSNKIDNIKEELKPEEKLIFNNNNLIEKINNLKNKKGRDYNSNNDNDIYIKKEIRSTTSSYQPLIFRIPSLLLDDKIEEIEIYIKLEMIYYKLKTITSKLDFISLLRQVLNNVLMLKNASFNVYMNLFNFILTLQVYELNLSDCNPSLPCEYLKSLLDLLINNKDLTDMIRIIIFLIKKYFPINMSIILEQKTIVILKVLNSYLKQLNNVILSAYINIKSIFIEINDFLFFSPPSLLTDEFPLAELYMEIYEEIRNTTDNIIKSCKTKIMKNELVDAIVFIKSKIKNPSLDYVKYLDYALYKIN